MNSKIKTLSLEILLIVTLWLLALGFSKNSLQDLWRMRKLVANAETRIASLESSNQELRRQLELLDSPSHALLEYQARALLGWIKSDEWLYVEAPVKNKK